MIDMDRKLGPWRLRVWGLVLNLIGNAVALVGIVRAVEGRGPGVLIVGGVVTVVCVVALAQPPKDR